MYPDFDDPTVGRSRPNKVLWALVAVFGLGIALYLSYPTLEDKVLLPQPRQAWVAIEVEGSGVAKVGRQVLEAGTPFTLHAVLEADGRGGSPVYYTTAERLEIGGKEVAADQIRLWDRPDEPRIRWFSVEGSTPYLEVTNAAEIDEQLRFEELYRADWPSAWAIPGRLEPMGGKASLKATVPFGTQRYHVRIEIYRGDDSLVPDERYRSWGAESLPTEWQTFPGVTAFLRGALRPASAAFGLTQIEVAPTAAAQGESADGAAAAEVLAATTELNRQALAFSRLGVVRRSIATTGLEPDQLRWQDLALTPPPLWADGEGGVAGGDLLQSGERIVVLYEDREVEGRLDGGDLVIDFYRGASLRRLDEVFEGSGNLSWVSLRPAP
jgi:hypothetical protein